MFTATGALLSWPKALQLAALFGVLQCFGMKVAGNLGVLCVTLVKSLKDNDPNNENIDVGQGLLSLHFSEKFLTKRRLGDTRLQKYERWLQ